MKVHRPNVLLCYHPIHWPTLAAPQELGTEGLQRDSFPFAHRKYYSQHTLECNEYSMLPLICLKGGAYIQHTLALIELSVSDSLTLPRVT